MRKYLALAAAVVVGIALVGRRLMRPRVDKRRSEHVSQSEESYRSAGTRILILGAGFGGLAAALKLDQQLNPSNDISILAVDRNNDMLFTPLLWTVANGRTSPNNVVVPIRDFQKGRRFHVLHAEIESIDLDRKEVRTSGGSRPYDILVIALGSHTAVPDLPGLREHALPFHTPADALQLRNHLIDAIEAAHQANDPAERQEWLTFVVGGAGDTGIELGAIIHDYITTGLFGEYPWLADAPIRVVVVGRAEHILTPGTEDAREETECPSRCRTFHTTTTRSSRTSTRRRWRSTTTAITRHTWTMRTRPSPAPSGRTGRSSRC